MADSTLFTSQHPPKSNTVRLQDAPDLLGCKEQILRLENSKRSRR